MTAVHSNQDNDIDVHIKVFPPDKDGKRVVAVVLTDQGKRKFFGPHQLELDMHQYEKYMDRLGELTEVELNVLNGAGGVFAACESSKKLLAQELMIEMIRTLHFQARIEYVTSSARLSPI